MIEVEFKELSFKNVRCHAEGYLDFPNDTLSAIVGPNGSGKSTHLMALCAVLFGRTAEGIEMPDLVNRKVGKNLEIELSLVIDKVPYEIKRYYSHGKHGNKLFIFRDGTDISAKTTTDSYKMIENLLVPRQVFLNTIYFSQQVKDFFTALTDKQQKDIFKSIFQTYEFEIYAANALTQEKKLNAEILEFDRQIEKLETIIDSKNSLITNLKEKQTERSEQLKNRIADVLITIIKSDEEIAKHREVLEQLSKTYTTPFNDLITTLQTKLTELVTIRAGAKLQLSNDLENLTEKKKLITDSIDIQLKSIVDEFVSKNRAELQKEISHIYAKANELREKKQKALNESIDNESKLRNELESNSEKLREELNSLKVEYSKLESDDATIKELNSELSADRLAIDHDSSVMLNELKTIKADGERLNGELKEQEELIGQFNKDPEICPTCGSKIEDTTHIEKEKAKIADKISSINDRLAKLRVDFTTKKIEYEQFKKSSEQSVSEQELEIKKRVTKYLDNKSITDNNASAINAKLSELKLACDEKINLELRTRQSIAAEFDSKINNIESTVTVAEDCFSDNCRKFEENTKRDLTAKVAEQINQIDSKYEEVSKTNKLQISNLTVEIDKLESQIKTAKNDSETFGVSERKILELSQSVNSNRKMIAELESQFAIDPMIEQSEKEIEKLKTEHTIGIEKRNKWKRQCDIIGFWKEGFSDRGIPSMLIDGSLPFMNETIRNESEKLAPGKYLIRFDTLSETKAGDLREKFSVNIQNLETGADKHSIMSGGERRQIDVCCMTMLRKLMENLYQKKFNITLFDEALDSLDAENAASFCRAMKQLAEHQSVVLITHSITQNSECDRVTHL